MPEQVPEPPKSFVHRMPLWVGIGVLVIIAAGFAAFQWYSSYASNAAVKHTVESAAAGDFASAGAQANQILQQSDPQSKNYQAAQAVLQTSQFFAGGSVEAVQTAKKQFAELAGRPAEQAMVVNTLIGDAQATGDPKILYEIYKDPPFNAAYVPTSVTDSLKNLAQLSLSLSTTSAALFEVGNWHATQILKSLNGVKKLSSGDLQTHADAIKGILAQTDALYESEASAQKQTSLGFFYEPKFDFSEGYLYGILALLDKQYLAQSEMMFNNVLVSSGNIRAADGSTLKILEPRLPYTHLDAAIFINEIAGATREKDVKAHLDALLQNIVDDPQLHQSLFVAFIQSLGKRDVALLLTNQARVRKLAELDPAFKTFLENNGWTF